MDKSHTSSDNRRLADQSRGTNATRDFYDRIGWTGDLKQSVDSEMFGVKEDGPIRRELHAVHNQRIKAALTSAGDRLRLLECGCGGNPEESLFELCQHYTGTDFSEAGLQLADRKMVDVGLPYALVKADVCNLPFDTGTFDAVYSAHMLYHIDDQDAQRTAMQEMMRVLRPGGVLVAVCANPRPILFPKRLVMRSIANTPVIGEALRRIRPASPVPYRPMPIPWMKSVFDQFGTTELFADALPTTAFNQNVSEYHGIGRQLWKVIRHLDLHYPRTSAFLGNYVTFKVTKR